MNGIQEVNGSIHIFLLPKSLIEIVLLKFDIHLYILPACFSHAGTLTLVRELSETNSANAELSQISVWSAADFASCICLSRMLRLSLLLYFHRSFSHFIFLLKL